MKFFSLIALLLTVNAFAVGVKEFSENKIRFGTGSGDREIVFDQSPDGSSAKITVDASTDTVNVNNATNINNRFKVVSTTKSSQPCPVMRAVQRDAIASPADGDCIYNTTKHSLNIYSSAASKWKAAGSGAGGSRLNLLTDASFEDGVTEGTCTNCTASQESAALMVTPTNEKSLKMAFSASSGGYAIDKTTGSEFLGVQGVVSCWIKTAATGVQFIARSGGSDSSDLIRNVDSDGVARLYEIPVVLGSTSVGFNVKASSSITGNVYVDECMVGPGKVLSGSSVITAWQSYTPTFTGFGTVTTSNLKWRQVGDSIEIRGHFTSGSPTGVEGRLSLPNNFVSSSSINTLEIAGGGAMNVSPVVGRFSVTLIEPSVSYLTFGFYDTATSGTLVIKANANSIASNGIPLYVNARVPIADLAGSTNLFSAQNYNRNCIPFTPSGTFTTNTTYAGCWSRDGEKMKIRYALTFSGAPNSTALYLNMPSGYVIDTARIPGASAAGQVQLGGGFLLDAGVNAYRGSTHYKDTTTIYAFYSNPGIGTVTQAAPFTIGNGDVLTFDVEVPIVGWDTSSVSTMSFSEIPKSFGATGQPDIQEVYFGSGTDCSSACTTGTCSICTRMGGKITSIVHTGTTGRYDLNGIDGKKYICSGSATDNGYSICVHSKAQSTSTSARIICGYGATADNVANGSIKCAGIP